MSQLCAIEQWCVDRGADHAHCPLDCEHPQPILTVDGLICGRCAVIDGVVTLMEPCLPNTCPDWAEPEAL